MNAPFVPTNISVRDETPQVAAIQPLRFWTEYVNILVSKPGEPEKFEQKAYEWVQWAKKGVTIPTAGSDKISRVRRDPAMWAAIQPFYDNWKAGGTDELIQGTPLNAWGGITRDEVEALKPFRIYSVEDFAGMSDQVMQRIPFPYIAAKRDRAKKWLSSKETADEVRDQLADMVETNRQLLEKIAALESKKAAEAKIAAIDGPASAGKGRKAKSEAA